MILDSTDMTRPPPGPQASAAAGPRDARSMRAFGPLAQSYENRLVAVLSVTFGVVMIDRLALSFLAPFVSEDLGLSNTQLGGLATVLAVAWAVSGVAFGRLSDRIGHQKTILAVAVLGFSLCSAMSGLAGSFVALLAARLIMGLFEGPVLPISHVLLAQASTPSRRGLNMGLMQMLGSNVLATFIAPILLIYLAERWGWRQAFFVAAVPGFLCAALIMRHVKSVPRPASATKTAPDTPLSQALRLRNIPVCALMGGMMVGWALLCFVFLPMILVRSLGYSPGQMSVVMSVMGVSAIASSFIVPGLSDRLGRKKVISAVIAVGAIVPLSIALVGSSLPALIACLLVGFLAIGATPLIMATIPAETVPPYHAATVVGLSIGAAEILGGVIGPLVGGMIADGFGLAATLWLQAGLLAVAFLLSFLLVETAPAARKASGQNPVFHKPAPSATA